ncbi:glycosyltransferase family 39 protein [soil metagenome]
MIKNLIKNTVENKKNTLAGILIFGFIIRTVYAIFAFRKNVMATYSDDVGYWDFAKNVISQGFFVMNVDLLEPTAKIVGPGIAWIDAVSILIFGETWLPIFIINCFVSTATIYIIYRITKELTGSEIASIVSAFMSSIYIYFIKYIPTSGKEVWMAFFFAIVFYMILQLRHRRAHYILYTILLSFLFTYFIHLDERYLAYVPLFAIFIYILDKSGKSIRFKKALLFCVFVIVFMTPWLVRNYLVYHRPIIVTLRTAAVTDKLFGLPKQEYWDEGTGGSRWYLTQGEIDSVIAGTRSTAHLGMPLLQDQIDAMRAGFLPHQFTFGETMWNSFKALWQPIDLIKYNYVQDGYRLDHVPSFKNNLSVFLTYGIMLIFAFVAMFSLRKSESKVFYFLICIFVLHTFIHVVLIPFTEYRYRIPIDSTIIALGSFGIVIFVNYLSNKRKRKATA